MQALKAALCEPVEHVAIIMDGNARWARAKGQPPIFGHRKGAQVVRDIVEAAASWGIGTLTLYSFSTENWKRSQSEVNALMNLLSYYLQHEIEALRQNNVRLRGIGQLQDLPDSVRAQLEKGQQHTAQCDGMLLQLALSYGGRQEILHAVRALLAQGIAPEQLDEALFEQQLWTQGTPAPSLIIRTSGEQRLSNFLLWQSAYAELVFLDKHWPDFTADDLKGALDQLAQRQRRFGGRIEDAQQHKNEAQAKEAKALCQ